MLLYACRPREAGVSEAPRAPSGGKGKWQTVWVDPQILESGKNFTLIRSSRLDSVAVEKNVDYTPGNSPSLTFHIETSNCQTVVELLDSKDKRVSLLIAKQLSTGHYKVSFDERAVSPGVYSLRALFADGPPKRRSPSPPKFFQPFFFDLSENFRDQPSGTVGFRRYMG